MAKQNAQLAVVGDETNRNLFVSDESEQTLDLVQYMKDQGMIYDLVKARDLVGSSFVIYQAKAFQSALAPDRHCWYCIITRHGEDRRIATVLGGQAVVDKLDVIALSGVVNPLSVRLVEKTGGEYGHYYDLE